MSRCLRIQLAVFICLGVLALAGGATASARLVRADAAVAAHVAAQARPGARPASVVAAGEFLVHAGAAYYVFEHYIWTPYKAGDLHGFTHVLTIAKAGLAALFVYHEVKVMAGDIKHVKALAFLAAPVAVVIAKLGSLKSAITGGSLKPIGTVQGELGTIERQAGAKGVVIKQIVHSL